MQRTISQPVMWGGIMLILATGLIHFVDAPSSFEDASYKGLLFVANGVGAIIAAFGIYRGAKGWGWWLGGLVAGSALLGYIISRTTGLPSLQPGEWVEPIGVASLVVEALYILLAAYVLMVKVPINLDRQTTSNQQ